MVSTTETGHAKNVANFDRLIQSAVKLGNDYGPTDPALLIEALQNTSSNAKKAMDGVGTANIAYKTAVKRRETAFEPLGRLATRIYNTLKACDRSGGSDETAKLYVRKIQGRRAVAKRTEEEKKADAEAGLMYKEVSASQTSFDNMVENMAMLVKLAASVASYTPKETDIKSETLKTLISDLKKMNADVISATSDLYKARALRNDLLYKEVTGLVDVAMDAKAYLKGAFGTTSPQFKEISGLAFRKLN